MATVAARGTQPITTHRAVVAYDPRDGRVLHVHHFLVVEGAQPPPEAEWERHAVEAARRHGVELEGAELLRVEGTELVPGSLHRVDPQTGKLVASPRPPA